MKRVLLIFALFGAFALAANAQQKACCAGKKAAAKTESCTSVDQATLEKAASADASIVKQVSDNGEISYARKVVDEKTGQVNYTSVEYCTKSKKFINASPSEGEKVSCTKDGEAKATKVSSKESAKACCSGEEKKACCAGGKKAKVSKTSSAAKAKLTNQGEGTNK
jgi:hypothetical protein